jgi:Holliday junction resolvase RusA-like endonuclease|tara:strand:- start:123 stop:545 length:423 start_codon:yes stop_codon:yes gene_type:complete
VSGFSMVIIGNPMGKERPRFARMGNFVKTYTPGKTKLRESEIQLRAKQLMTGKSLFAGALKVTMTAKFPIPKSWSKKKTKEAADRILKPTTKPDLDNIAKLVLDALNGIVYKDDSQVVELNIRKFYTVGDCCIVLNIDKV